MKLFFLIILLKIIQKNYDNFQSNKIRYFYSSEKLSLYKARNEALKHARGELIAYLDSDDWWNENYLSSKLEHFKINILIFLL